MIACCRRTPYLISKCIRRFCSTTPLVKEKVVVDGVVVETWTDKTTTSGIDYRMIQIDKINHRVLMITNPRIGPHNVYCSIRIGVGSNDEMKLRPGLAHLLEHVVVLGTAITAEKQKYHVPISGRTFDENTTYTFKVPVKDFLEIIKIWATQLFSSSNEISSWHNIVSIVKNERKLVDEEFHQKHFTHPTFNHYKLQAILKARKMVMPSFRCGNSTTLKNDGEHMDDVIVELDELRELYRQRPVFVFVYVPWVHDVTLFCKSWICYPLPKIQPKQAGEMSLQKRNPINCKDRLFVVTSDADLLQFRMYFPLNKRLNQKESRTFKFFLHLLKVKDKDSLTDYLVENKLGTHCETDFETSFPDLLVTINLMEEGLKDIQKVVNAVFKYIDFLVHEWPKLDGYKQRFFFGRRTNVGHKGFFDYTRYIAKRFDAKNDRFDESDLFQTSNKTSNDTHEQDLIKEQILENENVIYSIVTRDIDKVVHDLNLGKDHLEDCKENYYGTRYSVYTRTLLRNDDPVNANFNIVDMENHKIPAVINASKDVVYQELCFQNVNLQGRRHFLSRCDELKGNSRFYVNTNGIVYGSLQHGLDPTIKECFDQLLPFTMDDAQFRLVKNLVMKNLSSDLTHSAILARSLLRTAVTNVHSKRKVDPIPIQYNTLRTLDKTNYNEHFEYLKDGKKLQKVIADMENNDRLHTDVEFDADIIITSINKNQSSTLTYHFYEVKADDYRIQRLVDDIDADLFKMKKDKLIYTADCYRVYFDYCEGIVLKVWSVESVEEQTGEKMQELLKSVVSKVGNSLKSIRDRELRLPEVYHYMKERSIRIQIVGHKEIADNTLNFEQHFVNWFRHHKKEFENLIDITQMKSSNPNKNGVK